MSAQPASAQPASAQPSTTRPEHRVREQRHPAATSSPSWDILTRVTTPPPGPLLHLRRDGELAELVLDRADKRNALSIEMWSAIPHLVAEADADPDVKVLLLRGAGDHFSAGADIGEFSERRGTPEAAQDYGERVDAATRALSGASTPSIAVIRGYCIGGGCELALSCDLRVADTSSRFAITPATLGIVYAYPSTRRLVDVVGPSFAKYLLLSANQVDAEEARRARMVDRLTAPDALDDAARELATTIAGRSQVSVHGAKRLVDKAVAGTPLADADAARIALDAVTSTDYAEGVAAFLEKRRPRF